MRLSILAARLLTRNSLPRPGDLVRVAAGDPRRSLEPEALTFRDVWFPYLPAAGLARVISRHPDGLEVTFWCRRMVILRPPRHFRPLNRLGRLLARERVGAWLMARAIRAADPPKDDPALPAPQPPPGRLQAQAARARGGLRLVTALGGRYPSVAGFWLRQTLHRLAIRMFAYPDQHGAADQGVLIDRCTAILTFRYNNTPRQFRLDQVRRHANENVHLLGRLLPSGEPRTFSVRGISGLQIGGMRPGHDDAVLPALDGELWVELHALTTTAAAHHRIWAGWCADRGYPVPPAPSRLAHGVERALNFAKGLTCRRVQPRVLTPAMLSHRRHRLRVWWLGQRRALRQHASALGWRLRDWRGCPARHDLRKPTARWRHFLNRTADRIAAGDTVDPRLLLGLHRLCQDPLFARRLLHAMLRHEAGQLPPGDPRAGWITEALTLSPPHRRVFPRRERQQASALCLRLRRANPGSAALRWNRIAQGGGDRVLLLVETVLRAIYAPDDHGSAAHAFEPQQRPLTGPFQAAILLFAADWQAPRWVITPACATRWRWLAAFR